jgi:hypothetical protein
MTNTNSCKNVERQLQNSRMWSQIKWLHFGQFLLVDDDFQFEFVNELNVER